LRLENVARGIFFPTRFKRNYVEYFPGAVPFLCGSNIGELVVTDRKWLRPDDARLPLLRVKAGWILVTRSGSTGIISMVPPAWNGYAMSEHVIRIVPDESKLDPNYLQAVLRTRLLQEQIARGVLGSVIDEITPEFLGRLEIPVPTDKRALKRIVSEIRRAEEARQMAMDSIAAAVDELNHLLSGDVSQYVPRVTAELEAFGTVERRHSSPVAQQRPLL
jgi:hypothetical protein